MADIVCADVLDWAREYDGPKFHALLCDPPYGLEFMGKKWDAPWKVGTSAYGYSDGAKRVAGPQHGSKRNPVCRTCHKHQRGADCCKCEVPDFDETSRSNWMKYQAIMTEWFAALAAHLHPGAFGMAFASARGWHRLAVAIEDAGLRIHPSIFGWSYGSGFPKATRIKGAPAFEGHRYGLQALKPALEPIIVFQKPYQGKPVECITETGAGALWIDGGRIGTEPRSTHGDGLNKRTQPGSIYGNGPGLPVCEYPAASGRWPANFVLVHHPECRRVGERRVKPGTGSGIAGPGSSAGDSMFGIGDVRNVTTYTDPDGLETIAAWDCHESCAARRLGEDNGNCARFFFQAAYNLEHADPVMYQAKAARRERDAGLEERLSHPTVKPIALAKWLATLLLPPPEYAPRRLLIPFAGSGSEGIGAGLAGWDEMTLIEMDADTCAIAEARLSHWLTEPRQLELDDA